jgi:bisphosphoglycerate-independent phosphoglycerate mutase (AlkP superfamily)
MPANVLKFDSHQELLVPSRVHLQSARGMGAPVMLIIRDGWGMNPGGREKREGNGDATLLASTPFHDQLYNRYPWSRLSASGVDVGLPEGQNGQL